MSEKPSLTELEEKKKAIESEQYRIKKELESIENKIEETKSDIKVDDVIHETTYGYGFGLVLEVLPNKTYRIQWIHESGSIETSNFSPFGFRHEDDKPIKKSKLTKAQFLEFVESIGKIYKRMRELEDKVKWNQGRIHSLWFSLESASK